MPSPFTTKAPRRGFFFKTTGWITLITFSTLQIAWAQGPTPSEIRSEPLLQAEPVGTSESSPHPEIPLVGTSIQFLTEGSPLSPSGPSLTTGNLKDLIPDHIPPVTDPRIERKVFPKDAVVVEPPVNPELLNKPPSVPQRELIQVEPEDPFANVTRPERLTLERQRFSGNAAMSATLQKKERSSGEAPPPLPRPVRNHFSWQPPQALIQMIAQEEKHPKENKKRHRFHPTHGPRN